MLQLLLSEIKIEGLLTITIRDVQRIFPLNKRAKGFMEDRLDSRIKFQPPVFEVELARQYRERNWRDAEQAVYGLWAYFGLPDAEQEAWSLIDNFKNDIRQGLDARLNGIKAHALKGAEYWAYVIAYDRYESYPARTLGYFYDAGQLYANKRGVNFEITKLYGLLEECRVASFGGMSFNEIESVFDVVATEKYRDDTTFADTLEKPVRGYLVTPVFLLLKEEIRNSKTVNQTSLFTAAKSFQTRFPNSEFKVLITLIGCFFGYRKFYDVFYEQPPLLIFSENPSVIEIVKQAIDIDVPAVSETNELPTNSAIDTTTVIVNEAVIKEPEIAETDQRDTKQLTIFDKPSPTKKQTKSAPKSSSPMKTDKEILDDFADWLKQQENREGITLSDAFKRLKQTAKRVEELLATDNRFAITNGKSKRVILTTTTTHAEESLPMT